MKKIFGLAAIFTSAAMVSNVEAVTIDGITFNDGAVFEIATVFEDKVLNVGDELTGLGQMSTIKASDGSTVTWEDGDNGRELTYTFSGFILEAVIPSNFGGGATLLFSGGSAAFYSDAAQDFTVTSLNQTTDFTSATGGNVWLTLDAGVQATCSVANNCLNGAGTGITLISTVNDSQLANVTSGSGNSFFEVTGGDAATNFDLNAIDGHDLKANFSFDDVLVTDFDLAGSADIRTFAVPEPSIIALLGVGLLGFGFSRRKIK